MGSESTIAESEAARCPNDTDGDGDCHKCVRWGGCKAWQELQAKQLTAEQERRFKEAFNDLD